MSSAFNIGQDATVDFYGSDGSSYSFDNITPIGDLMSFDWEPITNVVRRKPISNNGYEKRRVERTGYKGTIHIGRMNNTFEQLESNLANNYHQGLPDITFDIQCIVRDQDGSNGTTTLQFTNCSIWTSKGDNFKTGDDVTFSIEFEGDDMNIT